jgi:hypothetical protein
MRLASLWRSVGRLASAALWLAFPVVPLLAEDAYYSLCTLEFFVDSQRGPDPYDWDAVRWVLVLGPLCGYGFLAGATWGIGDEPGGRWWRAWRSRRSVWVGLGPWLGLLSLAAVGFAIGATQRALSAIGADRLARWDPSAAVGPEVAQWAGMTAMMACLSFGWLPVAWAALRRSGRAGRRGSSWRAGVVLAAVFVGSLFGGYWAITTAWRDYFFDATIGP